MSDGGESDAQLGWLRCSDVFCPKEMKVTLRINSTAPDFQANTTQGDIKFHEWIGDG